MAPYGTLQHESRRVVSRRGLRALRSATKITCATLSRSLSLMRYSRSVVPAVFLSLSFAIDLASLPVLYQVFQVSPPEFIH